jgi:glycogen synthase
LHDYAGDRVFSCIKWFHFTNEIEAKIKIVYLPSYLNGRDGILNLVYYDFLTGMDLTVFPSYYEPWGYTPLESIAFHIPTITTSLSGFGQWVSPQSRNIDSGVGIVARSDYNSYQVAEEISKMIYEAAQYDSEKYEEVKEKAFLQSKKAHWAIFIDHYYKAYDMAIRKIKKQK